MTNCFLFLEKFILDRKHGELLIILLIVADVVSFLLVIKRKKRRRVLWLWLRRPLFIS